MIAVMHLNQGHTHAASAAVQPVLVVYVVQFSYNSFATVFCSVLLCYAVLLSLAHIALFQQHRSIAARLLYSCRGKQLHSYLPVWDT